MRRILPLIPLIVVVALGLLFGLYGLNHDPTVQPKALVGRPLPKITMAPINGGAPTTVSQVVKGPALVNFFFSTCVPCTIEAPQLMQLKQRGVQIVGIAYKDPPAQTLEFLDRRGNPFSDVLVDSNGEVGIEFGITGAPETFLVDGSGKIIDKHVGVITDADVTDLTARIQAMRKGS